MMMRTQLAVVLAGLLLSAAGSASAALAAPQFQPFATAVPQVQLLARHGADDTQPDDRGGRGGDDGGDDAGCDDHGTDLCASTGTTTLARHGADDTQPDDRGGRGGDDGDDDTGCDDHGTDLCAQA